MSSATPTSLTGLTTPTANDLKPNDLQQVSALELAQALLAKLAITDQDWHRLKANRKARASEQIAAAIVFLMKDQPEEALPRLQQAIGWLDRSISAPPCPTHGHQGQGHQGQGRHEQGHHG